MMMWKDLHNYHEGETGVVIGNGPSLRDVPLSFLEKYTTLGSNRIYILSDFTPSYYAAINPLVIRQFSDEINAITSIKFIRTGMHKYIDGSLPLKPLNQPFSFSFNPLLGVHEGYTVTYVLLQLAFWFGFQKVLLVGIDHRYTFRGLPNEYNVAKGPDANHFSKDYFTDGIQWNNPDLVNSERAYRMAKEIYEAFDREIVNLTPDTALDVFEKGRIEDYS